MEVFKILDSDKEYLHELAAQGLHKFNKYDLADHEFSQNQAA